MPTTPRRTAALLAGAVALTATSACSATTTTATTTDSATSTATAGASAMPVAVLHTPTPAPPTSPAPALANTGNIWPKILTSMIAYGQWLTANPNPALAAAIAQPGCASAEQLATELQALVSDGAYVKPSAPTLTGITGPPPVPGSATAVLGGAVTVDFQVTRPAQTMLHSPAVVTGNDPALPPTSMSATLLLGADGRWRFCTVATDDDPDGEAISGLL